MRSGAPTPVLAVLVGVVVALVACGGEPIVTATALPTVPADLRGGTPSPSPTPTPSPTPSPSPSPTPSPTATGPREPTDTDRARVVAEYQPPGASDLEHVAVDLDGDDVDELVFTYVAGGRAHLDVVAWDGRRYEVTFTGRGGAAGQIGDLIIDDVNADGTTELATVQTDDGDRSLSLWAAASGSDIRPLRATGGCAGGSHTYPGGEFVSGEDDARDIAVVCPDGTEQRYVWTGDTYRYEEPEPTETASPSPTETDTDGLEIIPDDD